MTRRRHRPADARRRSGVLVGAIKDGRLKTEGQSPPNEIWIQANGDDFRAAVNVRSVDGSDVLVHYDPRFTRPTKRATSRLSRRVPAVSRP